MNIVVVGASSGIGRALSVELAQAGASVALLARRLELIEESARDLRDAGLSATAIRADTSTREGVKKAFDDCVRVMGEIDGLIYNAASSHVTMARDIDADETKRLFEINFFGFLYWLEHVLPPLRERQSGFVAATTAMCAYRGIPSGAEYSASKGALKNLLESLRIDLEPYGVGVFQFMPGCVDTPMLEVNNMSAPMTISAEKAASMIVSGLRRDRTTVELGRGMSLTYRILRNLPDRLYGAIFKSSLVLPRKNFEESIAALPPFLCPEHGTTLRFDRYWSFVCSDCGARIGTIKDHPDVLDGRSLARECGAASKRGRLYSLLARFIWQSRSRSDVAYFRRALAKAAAAKRPLLGLLLGSLKTALATLGRGSQAPTPFLGVGPSAPGLLSAARRLRHLPGRLLYACEPTRLNLPPESFADVCCFDSLNHHSAPDQVLTALRGLLSQNGTLWGSYRMLPRSRRRRRAARWLQSRGEIRSLLTEAEFDELVESAGLRYVDRRWNGSTLQFALEPIDAVSTRVA